MTGAGVSYVIGRSDTAAGGHDALLVKTSGAGAQAWAKTWNGPRSRSDEWDAVDLARSGGVIVAGTTDYLRAGDLVAARYASAGARQWLRTWSSPGSWADSTEDLAAAPDGSLWVGGIIDRQEGDLRTALVKWSASGKLLFARSIGSTRTAADLRAVTTDARGNAYIAGAVTTAGYGDWDLMAAKYAPGGQLLWRSTEGFGATSQEGLDDIVLGGAGFLYACGTAGWDREDSKGAVVKIRR